MKTQKQTRRFVTVCVPGRDAADPGVWFVYDRAEMATVERCDDRADAAELSRRMNGEVVEG
jgi:hypothetical protein